MGRGSKNLWGEGLRGVMGAGFPVCVGGLRAVGAQGEGLCRGAISRSQRSGVLARKGLYYNMGSVFFVE